MNMFEVTTLGQPLEVLKTQMAANRKQTMAQAFNSVWARGGLKGFYQGLIPWVSGRAGGWYDVMRYNIVWLNGAYNFRAA